MIIPSVELPLVGDSGLVSEDVKTLTNQLAVLPEIFLCGSGDSVSGVNAAKPYKSLLWTCDCRVGPFDVLTEDHEESTVRGCMVFDIITRLATADMVSLAFMYT